MAEIVDHPLSNVSEYRMVEIRDKLMIDSSPINVGKEQMTTVAKVTDNDA